MTVLTDSLERFARLSPGRLAVNDNGERIDFQQLAQRVRKTTDWLARSGIAPGEAVGLSVRAEIDRLVVQYALMQLGCLSITLASHEPLDFRNALASRCAVRAIVCDLDIAQPAGIPILRCDRDTPWTSGGHATERPPPVQADAIVLTSSGTTGTPKLVRCTQAKIFGYNLAAIAWREDGAQHFLSPAESNAWTWVGLASLGRGIPLVFADRTALSTPVYCKAYGVTRIIIWTARLDQLVRETPVSTEPKPFAGVTVITGGSPVSERLRRDALARLTDDLVVAYGTTECGNLTAIACRSDQLDSEAVGRASPRVEIGIFDEHGRQLAVDQTGFIRTRSPWTATEYWQDEAASEKAFPNGWFQSGDVGRLRNDGTLMFSGRGDDMMILNSINIFPAEIEVVAAEYEGIIDCAAFPVESKRYGQIPVLAVAAQVAVDIPGLIAYCRKRLGTRAPRKIVQVDRIPRNGAGKVLRKELALTLAPNTPAA